jgi:DNA-binding GntR family transcriptional regulator
MDRFDQITERRSRQELSTYLEKKKQWIKATKEEEDRIRQMKKSRDYRRWAGLSNEINDKFWELANLKEMERLLEDKLMQDYNIKIYTKYGLFRSRRYDNIR